MTPWTATLQVPQSMGFSRQEHWSGLPFLSPGDLPSPGIKPTSSVILNGLHWKQTEINISLLRLHPSTAFQTLVDHDGYSIPSRGRYNGHLS